MRARDATKLATILAHTEWLHVLEKASFAATISVDNAMSSSYKNLLTFLFVGVVHVALCCWIGAGALATHDELPQEEAGSTFPSMFAA